MIFVVEFGQYWMHRLMHNSSVWWTHAPHHHITQLHALPRNLLDAPSGFNTALGDQLS